MTSATARGAISKNVPHVEASEKQIYASIRYGRRCTFHLAGQEPVTGYVAGIDRYNYVVLSHQDGKLRRCIIHKTLTSPIELHEEDTLGDEPEDLQAQLVGFREWVLRNIFGASNGASAQTRTENPR